MTVRSMIQVYEQSDVMSAVTAEDTATGVHEPETAPAAEPGQAPVRSASAHPDIVIAFTHILLVNDADP